ncbi:MAG: ATP-binding protein, partial [Actinomycetota bacterium]|nr:ATP-binding protein [Actinomycetota bacterium]
IRVRIVLGYLVLLTTALTIAVVVTRQVQINRVERDIETEQLREVEEISLLAGDGRNPDTGEPFGNDVAAIFDVFLDRNIPLDDEDYYTLVDGREYEPTKLAPDLYAVAELMAVWRAIDESTITRLETEFGEVWSLAVPVTDGDGNVLGVFAVVSFPDDDQSEVDQVVRVIIFAGVIVLMITSVLAWSLAGRVLRPVRELTATARGITDSDLSGRIPTVGHDELAELGTTFNAMVDRLELGFQSQRDFLDDVAHELRTPITIARGHLEVFGDDPVERAKTIDVVSDELDRMSRYVSELLLLAKSERTDFLTLGPVDLGDLAGTLMQRVTALAPRRWTLDHAPTPGTVAVVADQERLEQAIVNLAANAVQHTADGDEIGIGVQPHGRWYRLSVRDTGEGIDPDVVPTLFRRYSRGASNRTIRPEGMGIGLSIVDAIARAHRGMASAVSVPGHGATVTLTLPSDPDSTEPGELPPPDGDMTT